MPRADGSTDNVQVTRINADGYAWPTWPLRLSRSFANQPHLKQLRHMITNGIRPQPRPFVELPTAQRPVAPQKPQDTALVRRQNRAIPMHGVINFAPLFWRLPQKWRLRTTR
jgi:hypothetical protein